MAARRRPVGTGCTRFEFKGDEVGLPFHLTLVAHTREEGGTAAAAAFDRIHQLNGVFSDYDADSEVSRLSRLSGNGRPLPASPDLLRVLEFSEVMAERTGGAFDVTVGPLVNLWRKARREHRLPDEALLAAARKRVGYDKVEISR